VQVLAHHGRHLRPPPGAGRRRPVGGHRWGWLHRPGDGRGLHQPWPRGDRGRAGPGGHAHRRPGAGAAAGRGAAPPRRPGRQRRHRQGHPPSRSPADRGRRTRLRCHRRPGPGRGRGPPRTDLAVAAGVQTGVRGALRVHRQMRTNLPDVLAAGDCVETWHRLLQEPTYLPLGTTAHKQGRVAG
jgi:hypothetical protein